MLKIKDNVDLKELEKFGFRKPYFFSPFYYYKKEFNTGSNITISKSTAQFHDREIYLDDAGYDCYGLLDTVFDLIQAGLVEKVTE